MNGDRRVCRALLGGVFVVVVGGCGTDPEPESLPLEPEEVNPGPSGTGIAAPNQQPPSVQSAGVGSTAAAGDAAPVPVIDMTSPPIDDPVAAAALPSVDGAFAEPGPFATIEETGGSAHRVFRPVDLGADGALHPLVLWGNGTGAQTSAYTGLLSHWASHGFVVVAANTGSAGSGGEMLDGIDWLQSSELAGDIDFARIGVSGHSQGGGGAALAGSDPRVGVSVLIQPGLSLGGGSAIRDTGELTGPSFLIAGSADNIVNAALLVQSRYETASHVDAVYGILDGADHFVSLGDALRIRGYATAWFRAHLMDDADALAEFYGVDCGICTDPEWTVARNYE